MIDKKRPLISVIMPVYNQVKYLAESIESILNQTFSDFELIIVDDGCTDASFNIIRRYAAKDCRIKVIRNIENLGLTKSLNIALNKANGKYIARQDGDDISYLNRLQKQYDFLEQNDSVALVGIKYFSVNIITGERNCRDLPSKHEDILSWIEAGTNPIANMVLVRKDVVLSVGGYNEKIKYAQDYALYHAISRKYKLANIAEPLADIRFHDENITVKKRDEQRAYMLYMLENAVDSVPFENFYPECLTFFEKRERFQKELVSLFMDRKYGDCIELFKSKDIKYAIERIPRAYYAVASSLKVLAQSKQASDIFKELSGLKYADVSIISGSLFHLGEIFLAEKDFKSAMIHFEKCLYKNNNHKKAKEYIDKIKEMV